MNTNSPTPDNNSTQPSTPIPHSSPVARNSSAVLHEPDPEPWSEPVDGGQLLDDLATLISRFVVLPKFAPETLAAWVLHTYAFHLREVSTYLGIESDEKRCGKTTLLSVLLELVSRPVVAANISPPALFRAIEEAHPTLLIDETDTFLHGNDELRGILNAGYTRKTAYVVRVAPQRSHYEQTRDREGASSSEGSGFRVQESSPPSSARAPRPSTLAPLPPPADHGPLTTDHGTPTTEQRSRPFPPHTRNLTPDTSAPDTSTPDTSSTIPHPPSLSHAPTLPTLSTLHAPSRSRLIRFSCWCPKAMAAIGRLPDTLADRCIIIRIQRKSQDQQCERLRNLDARNLRRRSARFVADHAQAIALANPEIPRFLNDRTADIWEPLFALADLAGGRWPELVREAAVHLTLAAQETSLIGSLFQDLELAFAVHRVDPLFTRDLVPWLNSRPERPWTLERGGRGINAIWLSRQLRPYGAAPKTVRLGETFAKGYWRWQISDAYRRYSARSKAL